MTEQEEFECCLRTVNTFCDWVREADRQLQTDLREMRARHRREAEALVAGMLSHAEKPPT